VEDPKVGERWIELGAEESYWRITKITDTMVSLTGPGPCRAYQDVLYEYFLKEWERYTL
jgi:hypothetical protein